ncbi:MAG: hydrogenase maturation nickel metallochaperone HypA, partial [Bilophila wadsworthia]
MHEMSLVTSLLSIIREEMERHALHRLLQVRARYGALANIVPEALSVAFEALTAGT